MSRTLTLVAAGTLLAMGTAAQAQSWGVYIGQGPGYDRYRGGWRDDDRMIRSVCSGQRADKLERRLMHELDEGEIAPRQARRIHDAIDRLEDRQRHECDEGDWRSVRDIAYRYDQVGQWIENEAHGRNSEW